MLNFYINNYIIFFPFCFIIFNVWVFFFKNNFLILKYNLNYNDIKKNSQFNKKIHFIFFFNWVLNFFLIILLFFNSLKLDFNIFWFNHLKLDNLTSNIIYFLLFFTFFLLFFLKFINQNNYNYNFDFYFSIINIIFFMILLFLCNNLFSILFLIELNSLIFLYKFSVSKFYNKKNKNKNVFSTFLPKYFLNIIFFQYWVNFFSSILIMFFIFNIIFLYGSSEWFFINFINTSNNNKKLILLFIIFYLGFLIKLGIAPSNLFKIEIYKGLPFLSIFFYSVFYFFVFFLFFVLVIYKNFYNFNYYSWIFLIFFILIGIIYVIFLIFDINFFKSFFAYSTVINTLIFLLLFLSYF